MRAPSLSRLSHWLARRAVVLAPEQFGLAEGLRAAAITAVALLPSLLQRDPSMAWIAFAAFWACLLDPGGHMRDRARLFAGFLAGGVCAAWLGSVLGWLGLWPAAILIGLVGFGCGLSRSFSPGTALQCLLIGSVALAATGFPAAPRGALRVAIYFGCGCGFASIICLWIWRIRPFTPARRAVAAAFRLLGRMAADLSSGIMREAAHRQAVRAAIEQARGLATQLDAAHGTGAVRREIGSALACAERLFTAFLAIEHGLERAAYGAATPVQLRALSGLCASIASGLASRRLVQPRWPDALEPPSGAAAAPLAACRAAVTLLAEGGDEQGRELARPRGRVTPAIVRHAARTAIALLATDAACILLHLGMSYWALIAALLVVQPSGGHTMIRSLERTLGSIAGAGLAAAMAAHLADRTPLVLASTVLAVLAIALRAVNYTLFVWFLTALFVLVADLVMPGPGIAWLRVEDNALGSAIALACVFAVLPERGAPDSERLLRAAAVSTLTYCALVLRGITQGTALDAAQRAAGVASIRAEYAGAGFPLLLGGGSTTGYREALRLIRQVGGEMTVRRFDIEQGMRAPDPAAAERVAELAHRLEQSDSKIEPLVREILPALGE